MTAPEGAHDWVLMRDDNRAPVGAIARAALPAAGTDPTIGLAGLVAHQPSSRRVMTVTGHQTLTFRASVRVRCWIVLELVGQKGIRHANARKPLLDTAIGLNPRADQFDILRVRRQDVLATGIAGFDPPSQWWTPLLSS